MVLKDPPRPSQHCRIAASIAGRRLGLAAGHAGLNFCLAFSGVQDRTRRPCCLYRIEYNGFTRDEQKVALSRSRWRGRPEGLHRTIVVPNGD